MLMPGLMTWLLPLRSGYCRYGVARAEVLILASNQQIVLGPQARVLVL